MLTVRKCERPDSGKYKLVLSNSSGTCEGICDIIVLGQSAVKVLCPSSLSQHVFWLLQPIGKANGHDILMRLKVGSMFDRGLALFRNTLEQCGTVYHQFI